MILSSIYPAVLIMCIAYVIVDYILIVPEICSTSHLLRAAAFTPLRALG